MKDGAKLRAAALLVLLVAAVALGSAVYPWLSRQAEQEGEAAVQAAQTPVVQETEEPQASGEPEAQEPDAPSQTPEPLPAAGAESKGEVFGPVFIELATDFTVYDVDGVSLSLSDYRGKPVIVNFFASWCGPCRIELPYFEAAYLEYGEQIEFLMVDLNAFGNDTKEAALGMIEQGGYTFPVRFDTDGEAALGYSVRSIPTTLLVAPSGELLSTQVGSMSQAMLDDAIAALLDTIRR